MAKADSYITYVEGGCVCLEVAVDEGTQDKNGKTMHTVYTGRVPFDEVFAAMTAEEQEAALVAAVKAERDTQKVTPPVAPTITGTIEL